MPTTPPPPGHAVLSRHTQPLLVLGENCSSMFTQEGNCCAAGIKYFIWGKKCWPAFQNVCVGLPSHLRQAGSLAPYLLPTLGIILLSKGSQKKNKCHFDLHFSGDFSLSISSLVTLLRVSCLTFSSDLLSRRLSCCSLVLVFWLSCNLSWAELCMRRDKKANHVFQLWN